MFKQVDLVSSNFFSCYHVSPVSSTIFIPCSPPYSAQKICSSAVEAVAPSCFGGNFFNPFARVFFFCLLSLPLHSNHFRVISADDKRGVGVGVKRYVFLDRILLTFAIDIDWKSSCASQKHSILGTTGKKGIREWKSQT